MCVKTCLRSPPKFHLPCFCQQINGALPLLTLGKGNFSCQGVRFLPCISSTGQHASLVSALIWGLHFSTSTDHRVVGHHIGRWASPFQNKLTNPKKLLFGTCWHFIFKQTHNPTCIPECLGSFHLGMRETRTRLSLGIFKEITLLLFFD